MRSTHTTFAFDGPCIAFPLSAIASRYTLHSKSISVEGAYSDEQFDSVVERRFCKAGIKQTSNEHKLAEKTTERA